MVGMRCCLSIGPPPIYIHHPSCCARLENTEGTERKEKEREGKGRKGKGGVDVFISPCSVEQTEIKPQTVSPAGGMVVRDVPVVKVDRIVPDPQRKVDRKVYPVGYR